MNKTIKKLEIQDNCCGIDVSYVWEEDIGWELAIGRKLRRLSKDEVENLWHELASLEEPTEGFLYALKDKTFGLEPGKFMQIADYNNAFSEWQKKGEIIFSCE